MAPTQGAGSGGRGSAAPGAQARTPRPADARLGLSGPPLALPILSGSTWTPVPEGPAPGAGKVVSACVHSGPALGDLEPRTGVPSGNTGRAWAHPQHTRARAKASVTRRWCNDNMDQSQGRPRGNDRGKGLLPGGAPRAPAAQLPLRVRASPSPTGRVPGGRLRAALTLPVSPVVPNKATRLKTRF